MTRAQASPHPSAEALVAGALSDLYAESHPEYVFCTVLPDDLTAITVRVQRLGGPVSNVRIDRPIIEVDVITTKHISGDAGYGVADTLSLQIQADLFNLRGLPLSRGVIQSSRTVTGPRRIPDLSEDTFRFAATYDLSIHA